MPLLDATLGDARIALRSLARARGFAVVTLVVLTAGIAAVTTVFSVVNAAAFRPLPYPHAERTVAVSERREGSGDAAFSAVSPAAVRALRAERATFERVAAYAAEPVNARLGGDPVRLAAVAADSALLPLLGVPPALGRWPTTEEIGADAPVALVADRLWRARLGGGADVIGRTIEVNGVRRTVIGVMPPRFDFPSGTALWLPLPERAGADDAAGSLGAVVRLRGGVPLPRARERARDVAARLAAADPARFRRVALVLRDGMLDRQAELVARFGTMFLVAALLVLLVACANVGTLLLVRAAERRGEMAVRASLGASRARLVRQSLTESLLLGLAAGGCATAVSAGAVRLVASRIPGGLPGWVELGVDWRVLAWALGTSLVATAAFGALPARHGTRVDLVGGLKAGGGTGTRAATGRRGIAVQLALSLALLVGAALMWRSFRVVATLRHGYDLDRVLQVRLAFGDRAWPGAPARMRLARDVAARLAELPGVAGVAVRAPRGAWVDSLGDSASAAARPAPGDPADAGVYLVGDAPDAGARPRLAAPPETRVVSAGYFGVMGIALLRGRALTDDDRAGAPYVAVVSRELARALWPGRDPLGERLRVGRRGAPVRVVGVAADTRDPRGGAHGTEVGPEPILYLSALQMAGRAPEVLVRSPRDPAALAAAVRRAVGELDPTQAPRVATLAAMARAGAQEIGVVGGAMTALGACALALALLGTYGVVAYGVAQRTRELGVRAALGATTRDVVRLVVGDGMRVVAVGFAAGGALAVALAGALRTMLVGVSPLDPAAYLVVLPPFALLALVACWLPARRAARVDPAEILRTG